MGERLLPRPVPSFTAKDEPFLEILELPPPVAGTGEDDEGTKTAAPVAVRFTCDVDAVFCRIPPRGDDDDDDNRALDRTDADEEEVAEARRLRAMANN